IAAKAAKRFPSAASSTRSSCPTAAPETGGIGGAESSSKHMPARAYRLRHLVTRTVPYRNTRGRYLRRMSKQYLILIEDLAREGRPEREIDEIVREVVSEDELVDGVDDATAPGDLPAAA